MYTYIYIYRERERHIYIYMYIMHICVYALYTYIYIYVYNAYMCICLTRLIVDARRAGNKLKPIQDSQLIELRNDTQHRWFTLCSTTLNLHKSLKQ